MNSGKSKRMHGMKALVRKKCPLKIEYSVNKILYKIWCVIVLRVLVLKYSMLSFKEKIMVHGMHKYIVILGTFNRE
jgi:hypothetical protein